MMWSLVITRVFFFFKHKKIYFPDFCIHTKPSGSSENQEEEKTQKKHVIDWWTYFFCMYIRTSLANCTKAIIKAPKATEPVWYLKTIKDGLRLQEHRLQTGLTARSGIINNAPFEFFFSFFFFKILKFIYFYTSDLKYNIVYHQNRNLKLSDIVSTFSHNTKEIHLDWRIQGGHTRRMSPKE